MSQFVIHENEQRVQLQEQIETLAKQHSNLERAAFQNKTTSIEQPRMFYLKVHRKSSYFVSF